MRWCPICSRMVMSKRKDAIYCDNPRCRKTAYLRRQEAATAPLSVGPDKASVVVTFPDGSRWLLQMKPLQATDQAPLPALTQTSSAEPTKLE